MSRFSISAISDSIFCIPSRTTVLAIWLTLVMIAWPITSVAAAAGAGGGTDVPMPQSGVSPDALTTDDGRVDNGFAMEADGNVNVGDSKGNSGNNGNGGDSGNSGNPNDGKDGDPDDGNAGKGNDGNNGGGSDSTNGAQNPNEGDSSGDNGNSDGTGNSGNADNSDDAVKPDDAGKSDDAGKPDHAGKTDESGDSDESDNTEDKSESEEEDSNDVEESGSLSNIPGVNDQSLPEPPEVTVSTSADANGPENENVIDDDDSSEVSVKVDDVEPNQQVSVDVSPESVKDDDAAFDSISVRAKRGGSFTMKVTTTRHALPGSPEFDEPGSDSLARVRLDHSISNEEVDDVSFTFRVSKERIESTSTDPEAVVLYRHSENTWNELDTELIGETSGHYIYQAHSPGMSEFAIGAQRPEFEVWYSDVSQIDAEQGSVEVVGRVTNIGRADGVYTASLNVKGNPVARKEVTIAAGGTRQVSFDHTISEPGTYQLYLNSELAGTVTIEPDDVSRPEETNRNRPSGIFGLPFHWAVALDEGLGLFTPAVPLAWI